MSKFYGMQMTSHKVVSKVLGNKSTNYFPSLQLGLFSQAGEESYAETEEYSKRWNERFGERGQGLKSQFRDIDKDKADVWKAMLAKLGVQSRMETMNCLQYNIFIPAPLRNPSAYAGKYINKNSWIKPDMDFVEWMGEKRDKEADGVGRNGVHVMIHLCSQ